MSLKQQKRLYQAERCLWGHGREFSSNSEVVTYLNDITTTNWFIREFGFIPSIEVVPFGNSKWAGAADREKYRIYLKRRAENVILHELAHLLNHSDEHDEQFVEIFLHLLRYGCSFYAWAEFAYELKKSGFYDS